MYLHADYNTQHMEEVSLKTSDYLSVTPHTQTTTSEVLWRRQCREKLKARAHDMEKSILSKNVCCVVPLFSKLRMGSKALCDGIHNKFYIIILHCTSKCICLSSDKYHVGHACNFDCILYSDLSLNTYESA